jgi:putative MATE family efflux protein
MLLGDPKKAVIRLSIPMVVAMSVQMLYNLIDAVWVAGKGPEALSAVGFFFACSLFIIAIATGIGVGGGAVISQFIGARDSKKADTAAVYTLAIMAVSSVIITALGLVFAEPLFRFMGASTSLDRTLSFGRIIFAGTVLSLFAQVGASLLRSEGDARKAMLAMLLTAALNIVLDPFFIYKFNVPLPWGGSILVGFDLDVAGAGYATVLSMAAGCVPIFYWLFIKKSTYLSIDLVKFKPDGKILSTIMRIGIPTALMQLSMSVMMFFITKILSMIGGDAGVAIYTTGWRIVQLAIIPILGIGAAVTAVAGAAYGACEFGKMSVAYYYAIRLGIGICLVLSVLTFVFAPYITKIFTWSPDTAHLVDDITLFLRYMCIFFPATAGGMISSSLFQGTGRGMSSLVVTFLRTLVLAVPLAALLGLGFKMGLEGVYIGIIAANWTASIIGIMWVDFYIRSLKKKASNAQATSTGAGLQPEPEAET